MRRRFRGALSWRGRSHLSGANGRGGICPAGPSRCLAWPDRGVGRWPDRALREIGGSGRPNGSVAASQASQIAQTFSIRVGVIRGTARRITCASTRQRKSKISPASAMERPATTAPLKRWFFTSPRCSSRAIASRTGMRLMSNMRAISSCRMRAPSLSSPSMIARLSASYTSAPAEGVLEISTPCKAIASPLPVGLINPLARATGSGLILYIGSSLR
jgi:hypothetical protein